MQIKYVCGDATNIEADPSIDYNVIVHCCNNVGGWGSGFVVPLGNKWPHVKQAYLDEFKIVDAQFEYGPPHPEDLLGTYTLPHAEENIWVCNLIGQHSPGGIDVAGIHIPPIDYYAITLGLANLRKQLMGSGHSYSLHMPRMGCGLAGGDWPSIFECINKVFGSDDVSITVYDYIEDVVQTVNDNEASQIVSLDGVMFDRNKLINNDRFYYNGVLYVRGYGKMFTVEKDFNV